MAFARLAGPVQMFISKGNDDFPDDSKEKNSAFYAIWFDLADPRRLLAGGLSNQQRGFRGGGLGRDGEPRG